MAKILILAVQTLPTLAATSVRANVSLPDVISSGMVLQQKQKVPIWGHADPGETVTVRFAGQSKKATTTPDGKWLVKLDPLRATSTAQDMIISGKYLIVLTNILVGEVWLVSQPVAVRYAFNNNPRHPNLTNESGLPAAPFRTDRWPGPTDGKR